MIKEVSVKLDKPFLADPDHPSVRVEVPTSPGFYVCATITQATAEELMEKLAALFGRGFE
jgi:hypothetical protein